jgi:hypothetical protein
MSRNTINFKKKYLEIDSNYRDRNSWPNPAEFEISFKRITNNLDALDPISDFVAEQIWIANNFESNDGNSPTITVDVNQTTSRIGFSGDQITVIVKGTAGQLQILGEYYTAAVATHPTAVTDRNRIISYKYLGGEQAQLNFSSKFINILSNGDSLTIDDPSNIATTLDPVFFVPGGSLGANSYPKFYLFNERLQKKRLITSYNDTTKLITLDTSKSTSATDSEGPITSWGVDNIADIYSIRKKVPNRYTLTVVSNFSCPDSKKSFNFASTEIFLTEQITGSFLERLYEKRTGTAHSSSSVSDVVFAGATHTVDSLIGCTIRISSGGATGQIRKIISNTATNLTVSPNFTAAVGASTYELICQNECRRITKYVNYSGTLPTGGTFTTSEIEFPSNASNETGYYNNLYLVIKDISTGNFNTRLIKNYIVVKDYNGNVTSRKATIFTTSGGAVFNFTPVAGDTLTITSGTIESFSGNLEYDSGSAGYNNKVYVLPYSRDNFNSILPLHDNIIDRNSLYQVELHSLVIPNKIVNTSYGDSIRFYSHVYVELRNTTGTVGGSNLIISNNPNTKRALFRANIFDTSSPSSSPFIKIHSDHMNQVINFKPNDDMKFSVFLPNGDILETSGSESFSPYKPNEFKKVSALFTLQKIENDGNNKNNCDYVSHRSNRDSHTGNI